MGDYDVAILGFALNAPEKPELALIRVFGVDRETARRVVKRFPCVVKHGVSLDVARQYQQALFAIGARVDVRPAEARPAPSGERITLRPPGSLPVPEPPAPAPVAPSARQAPSSDASGRSVQTTALMFPGAPPDPSPNALAPIARPVQATVELAPSTARNESSSASHATQLELAPIARPSPSCAPEASPRQAATLLEAPVLEAFADTLPPPAASAGAQAPGPPPFVPGAPAGGPAVPLRPAGLPWDAQAPAVMALPPGASPAVGSAPLSVAVPGPAPAASEARPPPAAAAPSAFSEAKPAAPSFSAQGSAFGYDAGFGQTGAEFTAPAPGAAGLEAFGFGSQGPALGAPGLGFAAPAPAFAGPDAFSAPAPGFAAEAPAFSAPDGELGGPPPDALAFGMPDPAPAAGAEALPELADLPDPVRRGALTNLWREVAPLVSLPSAPLADRRPISERAPPYSAEPFKGAEGDLLEPAFPPAHSPLWGRKSERPETSPSASSADAPSRPAAPARSGAGSPPRVRQETPDFMPGQRELRNSTFGESDSPALELAFDARRPASVAPPSPGGSSLVGSDRAAGIAWTSTTLAAAPPGPGRELPENLAEEQWTVGRSPEPFAWLAVTLLSAGCAVTGALGLVGALLLACAGLWGVRAAFAFRREHRLAALDELTAITDDRYPRHALYLHGYLRWARHHNFTLIGMFEATLLEPGAMAVFQHDKAPVFLCLLLAPSGVRAELTSLFERGVRLTTSNRPATTPAPQRHYRQAFPHAQVDELVRLHIAAHEHVVARRKLAPIATMPSFPEHLLDQLRLRREALRAEPLWPLRLPYWQLVLPRRWTNKSVETQLRESMQG